MTVAMPLQFVTNGNNSASPTKTRPPQLQSLHIALVTETWPPEINGVAHSVYQLVCQLVNLGHHVSLYRPEQNQPFAQAPLKQEVFLPGFAIPKYNQLQFGLPAFRFLKRHFKHTQPDIVHIVTEGPLGMAALYAARKNHICVTSGYHTAFHDFSHHFDMTYLVRPILYFLRFFHNRCDATCVPSETVFKQLTNYGLKRLHIVGRGVDTQKFNPQHRSQTLRDQWQASTNTTVLMYVGRLSPEKSIDLVVKGYQALQRSQPNRDFRLVLVGDGPDKERLTQMDGSLIFAGMQTGQALAAHYASGDVFVFASQTETFGNVVTEAMASGLPVIAFDDAAAAVLVNDDCGRKVAMGETDAFINTVAKLPPLNQLSTMGQVAVSQVANMGWKKAAEQMQSMFYHAFNQAQQKHNPKLTNHNYLPVKEVINS